MNIDLAGRVAIVTGVGKGIGREIVEVLAREGVIVAAVDVSAGDLDRLAADFEANGYRGSRHLCDVRDATAVAATVAAVVAEHGRVDILINNAGVTGDGWIEDIAENTWDFCFDVNVKGCFLLCQAVIPVMKKQQFGRIINAASFAALIPSAGSAAYAASKAAVVHFTQSLAGELGPWGITANSYAPGMIPTTLNGFADLDPAAAQRLLDTLSLRRWGSKDDIASLICFLASDQAGYITGTLIDISGGKLATQIPRAAYERAWSRSELDVPDGVRFV
jgi:3-oxoacyl-[acyl-carrier protein] reductase